MTSNHPNILFLLSPPQACSDHCYCNSGLWNNPFVFTFFSLFSVKSLWHLVKNDLKGGLHPFHLNTMCIVEAPRLFLCILHTGAADFSLNFNNAMGEKHCHGWPNSFENQHDIWLKSVLPEYLLSSSIVITNFYLLHKMSSRFTIEVKCNHPYYALHCAVRWSTHWISAMHTACNVWCSQQSVSDPQF